MMMYWNRELENLSRKSLTTLQLERLRWTVAQASRSPYYGRVFAEQSIAPEKIRRVEDMRRLPFTTKEDLRAHFPYGLLCVDLRDVVRLHASSGTTGQPGALCVFLQPGSSIANYAVPDYNYIVRLQTTGNDSPELFDKVTRSKEENQSARSTVTPAGLEPGTSNDSRSFTGAGFLPRQLSLPSWPAPWRVFPLKPIDK